MAELLRPGRAVFALVLGLAVAMVLILSARRAGGQEAQPLRYELKRTDAGGYLYDGGTFDAYIAPDGTVTFGPVLPIPKDGPHNVWSPPRDPTTGTTRRDDIVIDTPPLVIESRPGVTFDVTDEYLRRIAHEDPLRAQKARFLAATFEQRVEMADQARSRREEVAVEELPARLERLWRAPGLTEAQRVQSLHALWDELGDGAGAARAREIIAGFAGRHLSAGEAAAFH